MPERRRRRWPIWTGAVLVVLIVLLVIADRVAAGVAEHAAESRLTRYAQFNGKPNVDVHGFPFLTQALGGKYDDIQVTSKQVQVGDYAGSALDVHLHGAHLTIGELRKHEIRSLPVDRVSGTVTVAYSEVARLSRIPGLTLSASGTTLHVAAPVDVPGLGKQQVSGSGQLAISGGSLRLNITNLQVGDVPVGTAEVNQLAQALATTVPVPTLPFGLKLTGVNVRPDGVELTGAGDHVTLHER